MTGETGRRSANAPRPLLSGAIFYDCVIFTLHYIKLTRSDWAGQLIYCARPSHTDHHFVHTASCVKTTLALPTKKLGCQEIGTNISSAYENQGIFSRRKLVIVLELLHLKMEVTVSEPCDVIRVY